MQRSDILSDTKSPIDPSTLWFAQVILSQKTDLVFEISAPGGDLDQLINAFQLLGCQARQSEAKGRMEISRS